MSFTFRTLAATAAIAFALPAFAADIEIADPYARSASPTSKTGAAFMQILNHGEADRLVGVASPAADLVQLHTHIEGEGGVMKMVHVEDGFDLPAESALSLERGGKHVMFMGLTAPLAQGDTVPITLTFEKAGDMTVDVPVDLERQPGAEMDMDMDHDMDHDKAHEDDMGDSE
ncbi:copper-binding protein [Pelagivirga sediminicola]|uniref:Copper-binding protein n=1 Tax=Pelagivirga sediminicola TaxID=2170575 RepID=A0A2T7GA43_9RHOB|nr:copper chaperone PCu(A)C [Pelagivirga sediminicola]PVA11279.1 copper-binding protein [Pelagivirga sediminicola]